MFFSVANVNDIHMYICMFILAKQFHFNSSSASTHIAYCYGKFLYC